MRSPELLSPLGILAGGGHLPIEIAEAVTRTGRPIHVVALEGEADAGLSRFPHTWVNWGGVGAMLRALRENGCAEMIIVGGVRRPQLARIRPDLGFVLSLPQLVRMLRGGDDSVLRRVVRFFEGHGLAVRGAHEVVPALLAPQGPLGAHRPAENELHAISFGLTAIEALGPFDLGQAAVAGTSALIAIEDADGTDRMLERLAAERAAARSHGGTDMPSGVLVKLPKPGQELRVDMPAIGPETIRRAAAAGLAGIAVPSGGALVSQRDEALRLADAAGLFVFGMSDRASLAAQTRSPRGRERFRAPEQADLVPLTRKAPSATDAAEIELGSDMLRILAGLGGPCSAVVSRGYVLAVEPYRHTLRAVRRAGRLKPWGLGVLRRKTGVLVVGGPTGNSDRPAGVDSELIDLSRAAGLAGIAFVERGTHVPTALIAAADRARMFIIAPRLRAPIGLHLPNAGEKQPAEAAVPVAGSRELKVFVIAGEHSGDALGGKLLEAIKRQGPQPVRFAGVGGEHMAAQGLASLFPLADVAVMGAVAIMKKLPRIVARVHRTVDAALRFGPDAVVIIDSPEFTHPIAQRIRRRRPDVPIIDYVSPSVWAWRPGRARKMQAYVDHVLALLPFEPAAHVRLGGPPCSYVGHPLIERIETLSRLDPAPLCERLRLDPARPVLVVLPGSRSSEINHLMEPFGKTVGLLRADGMPVQVLVPAVPHLRDAISNVLPSWGPDVHVIEGEEDKFRAFKLARAALAASGTVTLELALMGTPMVVAYKVDPTMTFLRYVLKLHSVVLANLVLGENAFPERLQEDCTPEKLAAALAPLLSDTPERQRQLAGLARIPERLRLPTGTPSEAAAKIVLRHAEKGRSAKAGP